MEFANCIAPLMEKCTSVQEAHHHWKVIYDAMKCVCNGTTSKLIFYEDFLRLLSPYTLDYDIFITT